MESEATSLSDPVADGWRWVKVDHGGGEAGVAPRIIRIPSCLDGRFYAVAPLSRSFRVRRASFFGDIQEKLDELGKERQWLRHVYSFFNPTIRKQTNVSAFPDTAIPYGPKSSNSSCLLQYTKVS